MKKWLFGLLVALLSIGVAVVWLGGREETPPTTVDGLVERLQDEGTDCELEGTPLRTDTSMYGGSVDISYETGTCSLDGGKVELTVFASEEQAREWSQESVNFAKGYWYLSDATWEIRTRSEDAARAIHGSIGGSFSGTEWSKHAWSRDG